MDPIDRTTPASAEARLYLDKGTTTFHNAMSLGNRTAISRAQVILADTDDKKPPKKDGFVDRMCKINYPLSCNQMTHSYLMGKSQYLQLVKALSGWCKRNHISGRKNGCHVCRSISEKRNGAGGGT